jgi:hypothetical protein
MSIFLQNKYTDIYFSLINNAKLKNQIKQKGDNLQTHHIIPKCMGGNDSFENLVVLTYKEHRLCHKLLIKMTTGEFKHKMMYAYLLFDKNFDTSGMQSPQIYCTEESYQKMVKTRKHNGSYKRGKENIFSSPHIIEQVRMRMLTNNPMKKAEQKERMQQHNSNPFCKPVIVEGIEFPSISTAARHFNTTPYKLKKHFSVKQNLVEV